MSLGLFTARAVVGRVMKWEDVFNGVKASRDIGAIKSYNRDMWFIIEDVLGGIRVQL